MVFKQGFPLFFMLAALAAAPLCHAAAPDEDIAGEGAAAACGENAPCLEEYQGESFGEDEFDEVYEDAPPAPAFAPAPADPVIPAVTDESGLIEDETAAQPLSPPPLQEPSVLPTPETTAQPMETPAAEDAAGHFTLEETPAEEIMEATVAAPAPEKTEPLPARKSKRWWGRPY